MVISLISLISHGQTAPDNVLSAEVNGKRFEGKATRMRIPMGGVKYIAIAGMTVRPDVQIWLRFYAVGDLKPGTYKVLDYATWEGQMKGNEILGMIDYTEETKALGFGFHDGESDNNGSITITKITENSIEGTFEAKLKGVYYQKRAMAAVSGLGLRGALTDKAVTSAGGGMLVKSDPHDHDYCRKTDKTDEIVVSNGKFKVTWPAEDDKK